HLLHAVLAVERHALGQVADALAHAQGIVQHVEAVHLHAPRRRRQEAGQDAHRRRLARAVRAEEADDLAALEPEAHVVHREVGAESPREVLDVDHPEGEPRTVSVLATALNRAGPNYAPRRRKTTGERALAARLACFARADRRSSGLDLEVRVDRLVAAR